LPEHHDAPSPIAAGLGCRCPRCGKGKIFDGFLTVRPSCEVCGLNFAFVDTGDGPAFFVMSFVGLVVVGLAMWVEFTYAPPIWLHLVLWFSLCAILSLALVRPSKALLMALQFHNKAEQGRLHK
jgi:uncharacterized protein (DUF983 family)